MNYKILYFITVCLVSTEASDRWPDHDISTLKLLQIVHRHGDRAPTGFPLNDPFKDPKYWVEGIGELTTAGKYRMYKLGQFVRQEYSNYLGDKYSPREVYARSSVTGRCIESLSAVLAGAYPPKQKDWQWGNETDAQLGRVWQPFPIETFMPHENDLVLSDAKSCRVADKEWHQIYDNNTEIKAFEAKNKEFYEKLSKTMGEVIDIHKADAYHDILNIEMNHNYFWSKTWSKDEEKDVVKQLYDSHILTFKHNWMSPAIQRFRAGGLVKELNINFDRVLKNTNNKKVYVYSTHDTVIAAFLNAMNIFNDMLPPFGSTLFIELHQNKDKEYFVRYFYHNETVVNTQSPYSIPLNNCQKLIDCPISQYMDSTKHLLYDDFDKECNN